MGVFWGLFLFLLDSWTGRMMFRMRSPCGQSVLVRPRRSVEINSSLKVRKVGGSSAASR